MTTPAQQKTRDLMENHLQTVLMTLGVAMIGWLLWMFDSASDDYKELARQSATVQATLIELRADTRYLRATMESMAKEMDDYTDYGPRLEQLESFSADVEKRLRRLEGRGQQ